MTTKQPKRVASVAREDTVPQKRYGFRQGEINRTNKPGTCLWCGRELRLCRAHSLDNAFGTYADNAFCGLNCGYQFGLSLAINGERLMPRKDE